MSTGNVSEALSVNSLELMGKFVPHLVNELQKMVTLCESLCEPSLVVAMSL